MAHVVASLHDFDILYSCRHERNSDYRALDSYTYFNTDARICNELDIPLGRYYNSSWKVTKMEKMTIKILVLLAFAAHLVLWRCDWIITCLDGGRFGIGDVKDNEKLSGVIKNTPLKKPMISIVLGAFAMTTAFPGYLALCEWMREYSVAAAALMLAGSILFLLPGIAHHVFCGVIEWFYIRLGKTEEARQSILEFFKSTSVTMYVCYLGLLLFVGTLFAAVVTGATPLPRWACVFNTIPLFLILSPFRIVGTGNVANATMMLALFFLL